MSMLFDYYGDLLTDKQKEFFDLYFNEDMSLTEIAEHADISRQGVRDAVVRAETILRETEDRLGLCKKYSGMEKALLDIKEAADYIAKVNSSLRNFEISQQVEAIRTALSEVSK
jgi:predicted DNA-binding protein YlxM (UPF0122 family)